MEELNKNIQVIAIETIAKKRLLLALKETNIQDEEAVCLALVFDNNQVTINDKSDLITLATSFNAYDFLNENQRILITPLLERHLTDENAKKINTILLSEKSE